ncbi:MAG: hypothetical protein M3159_06155, partial [Actinomycetota bacterium]|nr:hypothetical protein [Actinomycetota bacterium]
SYAIAIIAMLAAVIAAFVYLRLIVVMYMGGDAEEAVSRVSMPIGTVAALGIAVAFTVIVGILPQVVFDFARDAALLRLIT